MDSGDSRFVIPPLLNRWQLDVEHAMFKLCMTINSKVAMEPPFDFNSLIYIWKTINASWVLTHSFLKYFKLAVMTIIHVLDSVEDGCYFSSLTFLKNKLQATLNPYLPLVVGMYNQFFYILKTFPYVATFDASIGTTNCYGRIV
jgi:hypothetical protein